MPLSQRRKRARSTPWWQSLIGFAALTPILASGCGSLPVTESEYYHTLSIDEDGDPIPLAVGKDEVEGPGLTKHVEGIYEQIKNDCDARNGELRVVFIIHGGLISESKAMESARETLTAMGCTDFYPIFVNWETGMGKSYWDHLWSIRGGKQSPILAPVSSLLYLVADLGRAITRLPVTYTTQGFKGATGVFGSPDIVEPPANWEETACLGDAEATQGMWARSGRLAQGVVPGALRLATTFLLDSIGRSAYVNMQRRARVLFLLDEDMEGGERTESGALSTLMKKLRILNYRYNGRSEDVEEAVGKLLDLQVELNDLRKKHPEHAANPGPQGNPDVPGCEHCIREKPVLLQMEEAEEKLQEKTPFRITIIAHSMGTIVANELIRRNSDFYYDNIVFMGAACTIKEFADTTLVYVKEHPWARFYNLTLHPLREENERAAWGTVPFGSLLVWIDSYITERKSALDGTLGKWQNVAQTLPVIDYLRGHQRRRIIVTGFGYGDDVPQKHGEFNDARFRFWEPTFWDWRRSHPVGKETDEDDAKSYVCRHNAPVESD